MTFFKSEKMRKEEEIINEQRQILETLNNISASVESIAKVLKRHQKEIETLKKKQEKIEFYRDLQEVKNRIEETGKGHLGRIVVYFENAEFLLEVSRN